MKLPLHLLAALTATALAAGPVAALAAAPSAAGVPPPSLGPVLAAAPAAGPTTTSPPSNPILADGSYYSADPTALVVDDTLYVHAGRDEAGVTTNDFIMNEWQAFSTTDVAGGEWTHSPGLMRPETTFAWATPGRAYAGQVVEGGDGRFYWYVPVHQAASASPDQFGIGVAVSDSPLGPWTDHAGGPIVSQEILGNTIHNIDPTVYVDSDGRVYMYWGSFGNLRAVELASDMKTLVGEVKTVSGLTGFFEAAWLFERGGTYYLAYAGNNAGPASACTPANYHACIAYGTAPTPLGPWTYQGTILPPVSSTTSHPAIVEFKGEWFIVYHTADAVGGNHFRRSVAIDSLEWDDSQVPARIKPVATTPAKTADLTPRANVAPWATVTVSSSPVPTQYWVKALNDEIVRPNPLPPDMWGSWTGDRPDQQWLQYTWRTPVRVDGAQIKFWRDVAPGTGNGVSDPASWTLQSWDGSAWADVPNPSGYPTSTTALHTVTFDPVTTTQLRAVLKASPGRSNPNEFSALAVEEWSVLAAQPEGYDPVSVTTTVGLVPDLPDSVTLRHTASTTTAHVVWDSVDPADVAAEGTLTVRGSAQGYAAGQVEAAVVVGPVGPPPGPDVTAPEIALTASGPQGSAGWFVAPVTVRASATDDGGGRSTIDLRVDDGVWGSVPDVRFSETLVRGEGRHTVSARATDGSGNVSEVHDLVVDIDSTLPTATATLDAASRSVTVTGADAGSGLALLEYAVDSRSGWQPYTTPVTVDEAKHLVFVRSTDVAGNVSVISSVTVPQSSTAPLVGNIAPVATASASYTSGWNDVRAVNDDADSGTSWGTWPQVGQQWVRLDWDRTVTVDRAELLFFSDAADEADAGMIPPRSWVVQHLDAAGRWVDVETTDSYARDRDVFNSVAFTPVETTALRVVMEAWGAAEGEGSSGILEWRVLAADQPDPEPDTTAPQVEVDMAPQEPGSGWFRGPVTMAVTAVDEVDPAPAVEWLLDSGPWTGYVSPVVVSGDGPHTLEVRASDSSGNVSQTRRVAVAIDSTPPVTAAVVSHAGPPSERAARTAAPTAAGSTITFEVEDEHSGVALTEFRAVPTSGTDEEESRDAAVEDWQVVPDGGVQLTAAGTWTVSFRSTDRAGNVEEPGDVLVTVDDPVVPTDPPVPTDPTDPTDPTVPSRPAEPTSPGVGASEGQVPTSAPGSPAEGGGLAATGSTAASLLTLTAALLAGGLVLRTGRRRAAEASRR